MNTCVTCGNVSRRLKAGWTNCLYCSESCERSGVSALHNSMPGGPSPYLEWIPHHISLEITKRWDEDKDDG